MGDVQDVQRLLERRTVALAEDVVGQIGEVHGDEGLADFGDAEVHAVGEGSVPIEENYWFHGGFGSP